MDIKLTHENENKLRFVTNYGDAYEAEVSYNVNTKELRFSSDYTDSELYIPITLIIGIVNTINTIKNMED